MWLSFGIEDDETLEAAREQLLNHCEALEFKLNHLDGHVGCGGAPTSPGSSPTCTAVR